jgi:hypothetical protein
MSDAVFASTPAESARPNGWTEREKQALQVLLGLNSNEIEELLLGIASARATPAIGEFGCSSASSRWVVE